MAKKLILLGGTPYSLAMPTNFFSNADKFSVATMRDGHEALQFLAEKKPDLAILDVDLAGRRGDACCIEAKQAGLSPGTSIVLMAWMQNHDDISRCLDAGCDALLKKPLRYEQLADITTRLLFGEMSSASRFDVHLPIQYGIQPHNLVRDYSVDLSTGGVFVEAHYVVPVGTLLNVAFTLPHDGTAIRCTARVAWLNGPVLRREPLLPPGMGLEFLDIDSREAEALRNFLHSEERLHYA